MVMELPPDLLDAARTGRLVVLAGAGVSAGPPTSLPGWYALNALVLDALARRIEAGLGRPGRLAPVVASVAARREAGRFPPEYQAQLIEEACGLRYFEALGALDVDVTNGAHEAIAALAERGAIRAIVTTNFDRLIEHALAARSVPFESVHDAEGFEALAGALAAGRRRALPVLKVHGTASEPRSMVDTLKQRKLGRSRHLRAIVEALDGAHWLYVGFSAADLDGDPDYLGLRAAAGRATGGTFLRYPGGGRGPAPLGAGATALTEAFRTPAALPVEHVDAFVGRLVAAVGGRAGPAPDPTRRGGDLVAERLRAWADGLDVTTAGLGAAAVLEASGEPEPAIRLLDRLVRKEPWLRREPAFPAVALQYGRMGPRGGGSSTCST